MAVANWNRNAAWRWNHFIEMHPRREFLNENFSMRVSWTQITISWMNFELEFRIWKFSLKSNRIENKANCTRSCQMENLKGTRISNFGCRADETSWACSMRRVLVGDVKRWEGRVSLRISIRDLWNGDGWSRNKSHNLWLTTQFGYLNLDDVRSKFEFQQSKLW